LTPTDYHHFIYDVEKRRILGDFEGAYSQCDDVWPTQHQMDLPHFVYVKGLVADRARALGRTIRVLDVGCGYGDFVNELNSIGLCRAVGLEVSPSAARLGVQRLGPGARVAVGDLNYGLPTKGGVFDVVLLLGVLWFLLERVESCFDELVRTASPDADFIFSLHVPANPIGGDIIGSYDDFLNLLRRRFDVVDWFKFYQPAVLAPRQPIATLADDMLVRCRHQARR